jgi:hypothetical protein
MIARVFRDYPYPNPLRLTPGCSGRWGNVQFIMDEPGEADYVLIHRRVSRPVEVRCPPQNVWLALGEPPCEVHRAWASAPPWISRVYTSDPAMTSSRHRVTFSILPWHVDRDLDALRNCAPPEKTRLLSWITSDKTGTAGHERRHEFIRRVRTMPELNLFGRGFESIADKWDGLAPYRYSIAFENFSNEYYWTEKVMDCFLAWTMPIYFGCTRLASYFPRESFVQLDPDIPDPQAWIRRIINSDAHRRNFDAIIEARKLVLEKYNMMAFLAGEIETHEILVPSAKLSRSNILLEDHTRHMTWLRSRTPRAVRGLYRAVAARLRR